MHHRKPGVPHPLTDGPPPRPSDGDRGPPTRWPFQSDCRATAARRLLRSVGYRVALFFAFLLSNGTLWAQESIPEIFPLRPFNVDIAIRQQTFAPDDREIGVQVGVTAFRYGQIEVRTTYQYFSIHTREFQTDQHSLFLNPRWNNFIDILDFPKHKPLNRTIRHLLFGPLEDRAVPYIGLLAGGVLPGPGNNGPGHLIGGQLGVRFPVARGLSVDVGMQYTQYGVDFRGEAGQAQQWVFLTGVRF